MRFFLDLTGRQKATKENNKIAPKRATAQKWAGVGKILRQLSKRLFSNPISNCLLRQIAAKRVLRHKADMRASAN